MPNKTQPAPPNNPVPLTRTQEARREQILGAAIGVYCHYGFYGATLQGVAEAAGCSKALVVSYFGDMEKLATLCIDRVLSDLTNQLEQLRGRNHRNYPANAEAVFVEYFQHNRRQWRFVVSLLCTPALAGHCRELVPRFLGSLHELVSRYSRNIRPGLTFPLTYLMAGHYLGYILGGHEGNYRRSRDCFLPYFLKMPGLYEPFRSNVPGGPIFADPGGNVEAPPERLYPLAHRRQDARRGEILEAALKVFGRYGYHGATAERIAITAGVSRSLVFKYCGSVEETALLCIRHFLDSYFRRLRFIARKYSRFPELSHELWEQLRFHRGEWQFLFGMLCTPALDEMTRRVMGGYTLQLSDMLRESCRGLMPDERFPAFAYSLMALYTNYIVGGSEENFEKCAPYIYRIYFDQN